MYSVKRREWGAFVSLAIFTSGSLHPQFAPTPSIQGMSINRVMISMRKCGGCGGCKVAKRKACQFESVGGVRRKDAGKGELIGLRTQT